jgi:hypothetical protein
VVTGTFAVAATAIVTVAAPVSYPTIVLDSPTANSTVYRPVTFSGWAIDRGSASGTGVDAVYLWAYPAGGGVPQFMGMASYGSARPDIGAIFGSQFNNSGFSLTVGGMTFVPGTYTFVAFAHSTVANAFNASASAQNVLVRTPGYYPNPFLVIDSPGANTTVTRPFTLSGWAVDTGVRPFPGTGIDTIAVWAYPTTGAAPTFVGFGVYGISRPDVGVVFGDPGFAPSGYSLTVTTSALGAGAFDLAVFGRSTVTGNYIAVNVVRVNVQ